MTIIYESGLMDTSLSKMREVDEDFAIRFAFMDALSELSHASARFATGLPTNIRVEVVHLGANIQVLLHCEGDLLEE